MLDIISMMLLIISCILLVVSFGILIRNNIRLEKRLTEIVVSQKPKVVLTPRPMSFEECNQVIFTVINDVYTNKHKLYYMLKEISIIPNMDEEIESITKEVLNAFSNTQYNEFSRYYSDEYIVQLVTRNIQILLVEYTKNNKPNVG